MTPLTEADTCRRFITPALVEAGWDIHQQILEQRSFTDGRVIVAGARTHRRPGKRAGCDHRTLQDGSLARNGTRQSWGSGVGSKKNPVATHPQVFLL